MPITCVTGGFDLGGDWAVQFEEHDGIKCLALASGRARLLVEGEREAVLLEAGDCVILPNGRRFLMARDLAFTPTPIGRIPESEWREGIARVKGGGDTLLLSGHFVFSGAQVALLLGTMPPVLRLRDDGDRESVRWILERMRLEVSARRPGSVLVTRHLAHLLLVDALRLYLSLGSGRTVGWLFALGDPRVAKAARAIHAEPGRRWTLALLAETAGMSRSKFALRFKTVTGTGPIEYLTRWRMLLACRRLTSGGESIGTIAAAFGYGSEAAFSTAFKRVIGHSPRRYHAT